MEWLKQTFGYGFSPLKNEEVSKTPVSQGFIIEEIKNQTNYEPLIKLFYESNENNVKQILNDAWKSSPEFTIKIIFYIRNCRGGLGSRKLFEMSLDWLLENNHDNVILKNLENVPEFGTYKDLLYLMGTRLEHNVLVFFAQKLQQDKNILENDLYKATTSGVPKNISYAAKWAPSQRGSYDKKFKAVSKLCKILGINNKKYRAEYLTPLRKHLDIVEQKICSGNFEDIDYENMSKKALNKYRYIFEYKDPENFQNYKENSDRIDNREFIPFRIARLFGTIVDKDNSLSNIILDNIWNEYTETLKGKHYNCIPILNTFSVKNLALCILTSEMHNKNSPLYHRVIVGNKLIKLEGKIGQKIEQLRKESTYEASDPNKIFDSLIDEEIIVDELICFGEEMFIEIDYEKCEMFKFNVPKITTWNTCEENVFFRENMVYGLNNVLLDTFFRERENMNDRDYMLKILNDEIYDRINFE